MRKSSTPGKSKGKRGTARAVARTDMSSAAGKGNDGAARLYTLEVCIFSGPVTEAFVKRNPVIARTIQIRGAQTLEQLHKTIFKAFDRWEACHFYEFQVGGKGPYDPKARRYVLEQAAHAASGPRKPSGIVSETTIESLGLRTGQRFGYLFDYGDEWWHQVNVEAIDDKALSGRYPRITNRIGESPPQYPETGDEE